MIRIPTKRPLAHLTDNELEPLLRAGEAGARWEAIYRHIGVIRSICSHYARRCNVPVDDLVSSAILATYRGLPGYDASKSKSSTYISQWVRCAALRAAHTMKRAIRLPERINTSLSKLRSHAEKTAHQLGYMPGVDEISGFDVDSVNELIACDIRTTSIHASAPGIEDHSLLDILPAPPEDSPDHMLAERLDQAIRELPGRYRAIVESLIVDESNLKDTGALFGISGERARQMKNEAVKTLRARLRQVHREYSD